MVASLIAASLRFKLVVLAIAAGVIVLGVQQVRSMPVDATPEFAPPVIEVQTEALGLSAPEVEDLVTLNLEELLNGTPWLKSIHSKSVPGLSSIVLTFEPGTDVLRARQLVSERLTLAIAIPNVAQPPVILQPFSSANRVMMVGLSSKTVSPIEMGVLARWNIRPALLAVPGVANVALWGQRERQLQVQVDPKELEANHVTLDQVVETTGNAMWVSPLTFLQASTPGAGGWIETPNQRLEVRHVFPISTAGDLSKVTLDGAAPLTLNDVARVVENHQPLIGDAALSNGADMLLVVEKFPNANTLEVTRGVDDALAKLKPGLKGIHIDTSVSRPATFIDESRDNLTTALVVGGVLLLIFLAAALFDWRAAIITVTCVTVSLAAAVLILNARGETMNLVIVAGLAAALAVMVDDCVAATAAGLGRAEAEGAQTPSGTERVLTAMVGARRSVGYATLIALAPLLPVLFAGGVGRALAEPLVLSYVFALGASALAGLSLAPALTAVLLPGSRDSHRPSAPIVRLRSWYAVFLAAALRRANAVMLACVVGAALMVLVVPTFDQRMLPAFRDPDVVAQWTGPPGMAEPEMARLVDRADREIRAIPGVRDVGAHIGRAVLGDQVVDVNSAELWVSVDPSANYDATMAAIRSATDGYPGITDHVSSYLNDRVGTFSQSSGHTIVVRVFGPEFTRLQSTAEALRREIAGVDGVNRTTIRQDIVQPTVDVRVKLAAARAHGLKPGDVRRAASTMLAGLEVGSLFEHQKVFQVTVWSTPESRSDLTEINNIKIDTPDGGTVRLGDVASVTIARTPTVIERDEVSRRVDIGVDVSGRDPDAVERDIHDRVAAFHFPLEYRARVIGNYRSAEDFHRRMAIAALASAVLVFLLLQAAFQSWRLAGLALLTLVFALSGGVAAALLAGDALSLASLIGLAAVMALAARNALRLIGGYQQASGEEGGVREESVREVSADEVVRMVVTAGAVLLLLLPLLLTGSVAGQEIAHPMAVVVLGGLVTVLIQGALLIPAVYLRFAPDKASAA